MKLMKVNLVMSLSSFGKPIYENELKRIFDVNNFEIMDYFEFNKSPSKSFSKNYVMYLENLIDINDEANFKNMQISQVLLN